MTAFITDSFTGTGFLHAHTPDLGGTWIQGTGSFSAAINLDGVGGVYSNGLGIYHNDEAPASADYSVSADVIPGTSGPGNAVVGLVGRLQSITTFYWVATSNGTWTLYSRVANNQVALGAFAQTLSQGVSYNVKLDMSGNTIRVLIDDVERISATNADITGAGSAGVISLNSGINELLLQSFTTDQNVALTSRNAVVTDVGTTNISVNIDEAIGGTSPYAYQWYRSTSTGFTPGAGNLVSGATSRSFADTGLSTSTAYYYVCRVTDDVAATDDSGEITATTGVLQSGRRFVGTGNSQTDGAGSGSTSWSDLLVSILGADWSVSTVAYSGQTTPTLSSNYAVDIQPLYSAGNFANVLAVQEVMNHIYFSATGQEAYDALRTYCETAQATGWTVIVVLSQPDRADFPGSSTLPGADGAAKRLEYQSRYAAFLSLFLADWYEFCEGFIDPFTDSRLTVDNSTYISADGVHWKSTVQTIVANQVAGLITQGLNPGTVIAAGTFPASTQVLDGVEFGPNSDDFTGNVVLPSAATVIDSVSYGADSSVDGSYHAPDASEVLSSAVFGPSSEDAGTVVLPSAATVLDTETFGASSALSGTYHAPSVGEVLSTAVFGDASAESGTVAYFAPDAVFAVASDVRQGVIQGPTGVEIEGTLAVEGGVSPATPGTLIGQLVMLDEFGATEAGVAANFQKVSGPGDAGVWHDSKVVSIPSDANGLVEFNGITPEATYKAWRGSTKSDEFTFIAPAEDADEVSDGRFDVIEVIGVDE